jgi:hypothetical protein
VGRPIYEVPAWLVEAQLQRWLRDRAAEYLTPEVMAKVARGEIILTEVDGRICVRQVGNGLLAGFPRKDILAGAAHRVGCEEPYYRRKLEPGELKGSDLPAAKFIPAKRWVHLWPGAVAGWIKDGPRPPVIHPGRRDRQRFVVAFWAAAYSALGG